MDSDQIARQLSELLRESDQRIVFAESCTCGLIAATLGRIPGISQSLAGPAVVYQLATKTAWLQVDPQALQDPGPVSQVVSEQMARGVLQMTPHATMAAGITGHLGPDAPPDQDGVAWTSVAVRHSDEILVVSRRLQLDAGLPQDAEQESGPERRHRRQVQAVGEVLRFCVEQLQG